MGDDREDAMAEQANLALYLLGALPDDERADFERHLAGCDRCMAEALDLGPTTSGLGQFTDEDIDAFLTAIGTDSPIPPFPIPPGTVPAAGPALASPEPAPVSAGPAPVSAGPAPASPEPTPASAGSAPAAPRSRPDGPSRPADNRPGGTAPRSRRRRALIAGAAAVLLVFVTGLSLLFLRTGPSAGPADPALVTIAEAESSGVGLSVSVIETPDQGLTARATVSGLRPGVRYRLYAVTRAGINHTVRDWTGTAGIQEIDGPLPVPADTLAFFGVAPAGEGPLVIAPVTAGTPTPR